MLDILFLSRLIPYEIELEVRAKMSNTMDEAAIAWQHHIIEGIERNINAPIKLLNYLPIKSYPKSYVDAYIRKSYFSHRDGVQDINLSFCNVQYIKRLLQGKSLYREVRNWAKKKSTNPKVLIAYTLYPEYLEAIRIAKKIDPSIIATAIVLDLPEYCILKNKINWKNKLYLWWSKKVAQQKIQHIDCFGLLTEAMASALEIEKPYCIIEGISTTKFPAPEQQYKDGCKHILYAGTLHEKFGVLDLLKAFQMIDSNEYRLVICGYGDSEKEILAAVKDDIRIDFRGQLPRNEVLQLMQEADVIVNPRKNREVFTKYSFPSKNIEALSSGKPFIGYKLEGIPDEYDQFINYPADDTDIALSKKIVEICEEKKDQAISRAIAAKKWVAEHKEKTKQAEKLLNLIQTEVVSKGGKM